MARPLRSRALALATLVLGATLALHVATSLFVAPNSPRGQGPTVARRGRVAMCFKPGIKVEKLSKADADKKFGVSSWPTWGCGVSKFDWEYSGTEVAYMIEGEVVVTPTGEWADSEPATVVAGDLATFPDGMTCVWDVKKPIKKHYSFN
mmetsp:Transcript_118558/g.335396  ORF Transcript_118558/g.335396 Transcript_118558/m.335396 type:complete len:149 (-) Transcript_118558:163-609(-)